MEIIRHGGRTVGLGVMHLYITLCVTLHACMLCTKIKSKDVRLRIRHLTKKFSLSNSCIAMDLVASVVVLRSP